MRRLYLTRFGIAFSAICFFLFYLLSSEGFRFTSESSVRALNIHGSLLSIVCKEHISEDLDFYIIDNGEQYNTAYSKRDGLLWKAAVGIQSRKKTDDQIELLNLFYFDDSIGWLVSLSHDPDADSFEITFGDQTITKKAAFNLPTAIILYPCTQMNMGTEFSAAALSKDGEALYQLDYLMENNTVYVSQYRWWPAAVGP